MASIAHKYLATEVLFEQRTISYRNVARALKVHVNSAKCMLYDFHVQENQKKAKSVCATYLVSGTKKITHTNGHVNGNVDIDEEPMPPSSPPALTSSMLNASQEDNDNLNHEEIQHVPVRTIMLVRENALEAAKEQFQSISSIHIYSVSLHQVPDLMTLTDTGRVLFTNTFVNEDPLIHNKSYGVILNPGVRRRKGKRPVVAEAVPHKPAAVKSETKAISTTKSTLQSAKTSAPASKIETPSRPGSPGSTNSAHSTKQATLKRDASDIFKSFAKAKSKPQATLKRSDTDTSANASAADGGGDAQMLDDDEEESEEEAMFLDTGTKQAATSKKRASDVRREREDKTAKLRRMMDSDGEDDLPVPQATTPTDIKTELPTEAPGEDAEKAEAANVAWSDSDGERQEAAPGKDAAVSTKPGRRRGRRKVMKKRTMKDEEGYLVTKEEAVWESFSEDEPAPRPRMGLSTGGSNSKADSDSHSGSTPSSQTKGTAGGKAAAGKGGAKGGNIMSFFGKK